MSTLLSATDIVVRHNDRTLLNGATLTIGDRDRVGMVGRNGSGKSTLLRIMAGLQQPDSGEVTRRRDLLIGYLSQEFSLDATINVEQNVRSGTRHIQELIHEFERLSPTSGRHDVLEERIRALDGWNLDSRIAAAMAHLNCPDGDRSIRELSGGEQRRVALCRAIVARPDLLVLDEPTNHLDTESIEWVVEYLADYPGAFVLVTHDRYFLDQLTNCIAELANGIIHSYTGNYSDYLAAWAEREAAEEVIEHKRQMFLKRELDWVRRGPKARTTKSKGRIDRYYEVAEQQTVSPTGDMELVVPPPPPIGNRVVDLCGVGIELGGKRLFANLNFTFTARQRVGVTGRNGLGKTTLLKIILGLLPPAEGLVKTGQLTRFNYVDQGRLQVNEEHTLLEAVSDGTEFVLFGETRLSLRSYLKRFLFTDDRIVTQVKHLSGGERSRLTLARILKNGGNFLILDEPTNDLDLQTLRVLEEALLDFPGTVLVVSHDRYFLDRVCTDILSFEGEGQVTHFAGDYSGYAENRKLRQAAAAKFKPAAPVKAEPIRKTSSSRARKLSFKETRELEGMEATIMTREEKVAEIETLFLDADFHRKHGQRTGDLMAELAADKAEIVRLYARWEELEAIRSGTGPD
jgi:ATP-binding cassette subfamily F protein uup